MFTISLPTILLPSWVVAVAIVLCCQWLYHKWSAPSYWIEHHTGIQLGTLQGVLVAALVLSFSTLHEGLVLCLASLNFAVFAVALWTFPPRWRK